MVLKDARNNKRNLACCWIDVKKAYDSVSHSWVLKMLEIHRFPEKIRRVIAEIMKNWNTVLIVPLEDGDINSEPIPITNGLFQGDVMSGDCFKLSLNPVSWELRRSQGYKLSRPISEKITHVFFMDDLKIFIMTLQKLIILMSDTKAKMSDAGLEWNAKKCNILLMKNGEIDLSTKVVTLNDDTKIDCLSSEDLYKFLGIPENVLHDVEDIVKRLKKVVQQRTNVVWTSPLSEYNKVVATNVFVHSSLEYFMWSEKFKLEDIRDMDQSIRTILNEQQAKYKLQLNESLYLPRKKGGRGLKCLETTYKKTKVVAAANLLTREEPRIELVRQFERLQKEKGRSSLLTDAVLYAEEDFDVHFIPSNNNFTLEYEKKDEMVLTANKEIVKSVLKANAARRLIQKVSASTWQGVILKARYSDPDLISDSCFNWLSNWKDAPMKVINDFQSIYLQTVPTLTFQKYRGQPNINSTLCRLCKNGEESVKHLLSNCGKFAKTLYKRRHDRVLQFIMLKFLHKNNLIEKFPPWYTNMCIKPHYTNDSLDVYWDIPEYSGYDNVQEQEQGPLRPDGKIVNRESKTIFVLEMSIPWITNRSSKLEEKEAKYTNIVQSLKVDNPGYSVKQLTFIIDCMAGYSKDLVVNLELMNFTNEEMRSILPGIQRIVVTEANSVINNFKVATMK